MLFLYFQERDVVDINKEDSSNVVWSQVDKKVKDFPNQRTDVKLFKFRNSYKKNNLLAKFLEQKFDDAENQEKESNVEGIPWRQFDTTGYVGKTLLSASDDEYKRNKFNQRASDRLKCDRPIPDTRHNL